MGRLTNEPFRESCCDGGSCTNMQSAQPCGCDAGCKPEPHVCEWHIKERKQEVMKQPWSTAELKRARELNELCDKVHLANEKWWTNLETGERLDRNVGEMLCLVHSEISEAMEGHRKNLMDDKLPMRQMIEVELADAIIRIFDIAAGLELDLGGAFVEKMAYNATRQDHTKEARLEANGKKY